MNLFEFYIKRTRSVHIHHAPSNYSYDQEQTCYSQSAYLESLDAAKAFAQQHAPVELVWEPYGDTMQRAVWGDAEFMVSQMSGVLNPAQRLEWPEHFGDVHSPGD